ncbi:hypothetical protein Spb1_24640 [Planctopirus ephydatiae]|uniref:Putative restriction endonuclease domain-containing protein n=1 Tax=Planctopirus ephydatiae TaxID=2528019 RepID=A0A518GPI0_9PLAN|nr:Uma2 family endonuclease [Planctopirus ephydatiae]QDV30530.1 hypothetical protein Spb1_24640 [Planctopirus ephydatiae]
MSIAPMPPVTLNEFLRNEAEAGEGVRLELIHGEIRETDTTTRSAWHSFFLAQLVARLVLWQDSKLDFQGSVAAGEVRCQLDPESESVVGIDVGVWDQEAPSFDPPLYEGPPVVAAEILSPSDTVQGVSTKTELYLKSGVGQVWILDPVWKTVTVFRKGQKPILLGDDDLLSGEGELPGFSVPVSRFFGKLKDVASPSEVH